jgi:DHA2 family multidrug resistance protein
MMATMALLPPMLQQLYGDSVLQTGLMLTPRGFGVVISMAIVARLMQRGMDPRILIALGLAIAAGSLWQMTGWSLVMGTQEFLVSGFIQGIGLGLMFTPLQNVAFATLTSQHRTEGSSLMNLSRSIGASVGISVVTTLLSRNIQVSHADLAPHVSAEGLQTLDPNLLQALGSTGQTVMAMANAEINKQAAMIAYLDNFWLMAIVTLAAIPLVLLIRRPKGPVVIDPGAGGHLSPLSGTAGA